MVFPRMERTKDPRGLAPRSASTPVARPRTPITGDASLEPFLASGAGSTVDCPHFPAAAAGRAASRKQSGWTEKARLVQAAVGAEPDTEGQTAWHRPGGPSGSGRLNPPPRQGPVARKEGYTPLKFCPPDGISRQRGRKKRRFGSFAAVGKGTRRRSGGTLPKTNKAGATGKAAPLFCVQNGRRGETKFRRKFFCLLFFLRKVGARKRAA